MMEFEFDPDICEEVEVNELKTSIPLTKYLKENNKSTKSINSVYLYQFTAPGEWCQILWEFQDESTLERLKDRVTGRKNDQSGKYMHNRALSSLSKDEKAQHYEDVIRA